MLFENSKTEYMLFKIFNHSAVEFSLPSSFGQFIQLKKNTPISDEGSMADGLTMVLIL